MPPNEEPIGTDVQNDEEIQQRSSQIDVEELAKEVMKLIKKNLREENERLPR